MTTSIAFIHKKKIYIATDGQATNNNEFIRRTDDKKWIARKDYFIITSGLAFARDLLAEKHKEMPCKNQKDTKKILENLYEILENHKIYKYEADDIDMTLVTRFGIFRLHDGILQKWGEKYYFDGSGGDYVRGYFEAKKLHFGEDFYSKFLEKNFEEFAREYLEIANRFDTKTNQHFYFYSL